MDTLLSMEQVRSLISQQLIADIEAKPVVKTLPKPIKIPFTNNSYWYRSDIEMWIGNLKCLKA